MPGVKLLSAKRLKTIVKEVNSFSFPYVDNKPQQMLGFIFCIKTKR